MCLARNSFTKTKRHRYPGQQPETKCISLSVEQPQENRWSKAGFVVPSVFNYKLDCLFFRKDVQVSCFRYLVETRDRNLLGEPNGRRPLARRWAALPRPARSMSGFSTRLVFLLARQLNSKRSLLTKQFLPKDILCMRSV